MSSALWSCCKFDNNISIIILWTWQSFEATVKQITYTHFIKCMRKQQLQHRRWGWQAASSSILLLLLLLWYDAFIIIALLKPISLHSPAVTYLSLVCVVDACCQTTHTMRYDGLRFAFSITMTSSSSSFNSSECAMLLQAYLPFERSKLIMKRRSIEFWIPHNFKHP